MWDLKLNNSCNHRIINEELDIKGVYPNYYAVLKRPVYGNNLQVNILSNDYLFFAKQQEIENSENIQYINYQLQSDRKTLIFNLDGNIQIDIREGVYPLHTYYATYYTRQEDCPKCIYGTNRTNDVYVDVLGRPIITAGLDLLIQRIKKMLITALESNVFDENYGSELPKLIGKTKTVLTLLKAQNTIQQSIEKIQLWQINNYELLSEDEKLIKIDNFQVLPTSNPKVLKFSFEVYTLSGKNINIGVTI